MSQYSALYCDQHGLVAWKVYYKIGWLLGGVSQYNLECCSLRQGCLCHKTSSCVARHKGLGSWALGWGSGRAQAGTAGVRGRLAWRAGKRAWARGQVQAGGSSARAQRARGRARQAGRR